eukprot:gnl/MRDRNA2_/MRDRNA2_63682_c0_seq2.p1 gnl/MRDRNA2_/MRDRNA2_63682_c0~~gnl/MRDRNA2_/MRDRNA2_63682_c0_seq2.p1  ORF type:complete len:538 (-),score=74.61 gnl/MRDRNA2_/MRDRNA2_63682_c0_seq2:38-1552(-)
MATTTQYEDCVEAGLSVQECVTWVNTVEPYKDSGVGWQISLYVMALHNAVTILVHPHSCAPTNVGESVGFILLTFLGGFIWTDVISRSTSITASLNRHNIGYHETIDDLHIICEDLGVPHWLRIQLRQFFMNTKDYSERKTWKQIEARMSPQLRGEMSYELNRVWWLRVPYLSKCSRDMRIACSENMRQVMFAQRERFGSPFTMYILNRGLVARPSQHGSNSTGSQTLYMRFAGAVWGEEHLLLNHWWLLEPTTSLAVTFSETLTIDRDTFARIASEHPENSKFLRKAYLKLLLLRGLLFEAQQIRLAEEEAQTPGDVGRRKSETYVRAQGLIKKGLEYRSGSETGYSPRTPFSACTNNGNDDRENAAMKIKPSAWSSPTASPRVSLASASETASRKNAESHREGEPLALQEPYPKLEQYFGAPSLSTRQSSARQALSTKTMTTVWPPTNTHPGVDMWTVVEQRIYEHFEKLHTQLLGQLAQRGEELESKLDNILDTFSELDEA